ncbi:hypothetical protein MAR_007510, partial [Mya arenaria]
MISALPPKAPTNAFVMVLDFEDIKRALKYTARQSMANIADGGCPNGYVPHISKNSCLPLFCPAHQIQSEHGCVNVAKMWHFNGYLIGLKLSEKQPTLSVEMLDRLRPDQ